MLLATNLLVLALPFAGVSLLRLYDSMLIRQTESELIVQGAVVAAIYLADLRARAEVLGVELDDPESSYGAPLLAEVDPGEHWRPAIASLDLARHPVLPPVPPARAATEPADSLAIEAGEGLRAVLEETQRTTLAGLRVVDGSGTVVATSGSEDGLNLANRPEVQAALAGFRASVLRQRDRGSETPPLGSISRGTGLRVVVAFPVVAGQRVLGAVVLARTPMSVRQALYRDRRYFVLGAVVAVSAVGLLAFITAAALGRPLRDLIEQTERVRKGEKGAAKPLARPVTEEVAQISRAVAEMATTLESRADYIAIFATNVSHELKTPLTSIRGTVELLHDHLEDMTPEEQRRFLTMLEKDSARLERLVERLLELARADVVRPGESRTRLVHALETAVERHRARGLDVRLEGPGEWASWAEPRLAMAAEVFDSILSNLLDNARHHGGEGVHVVVRAVVEASGHASEGETRAAYPALRLEITDDGPGISPANLERVWNRFFTTRRGDGGSGLGLSIVHALVVAHGGTIEVKSRPGETVFSLVLPIAE